MSKLGNWVAAVGLPLLLCSALARAEDIDIYTGLNPSAANPPTVLLVWDNAANNSASAQDVCTQYADGSGAPSLGTNTASGMEQCAMVNALLTLKSDPDLLGKVKIGLMIFNKNGFSNNGNGQCGYLVRAPALMDSTGVSNLIADIKGFQNTGSNSVKTNGVAVGATMAEAWAMLNGKSNSCSGVNYSNLAEVATQCRDAVLIYIGNAFTNANPGDGGDADVLLKSELTGSFGYSTGSNQYSLFTDPISVPLLNTSGNDNNDYWADEWARFMKRASVIDSAAADKNVTTYTISVTDVAKQDQAQPVINYYGEMAQQGGGKSFLVDFHNTSGLSDAILSIFNDVQAENSVFASATLPVTANTQGTYLNQVFVAMFRPDDKAHPRWYGNLKQYQLGLDSHKNIVLTDSTEDPNAGAVISKTNSETGAISPDAVSFWTTDSNFWINSPSGEGLQSDYPDGDLVEKGGAAEMARADNLDATYADSNNDNGRNLLTCDRIGGCGSGLTEFSTGNATLMANASSLFGVGTATSFPSATLTAGDAFKVGAANCNASGGSKYCTFEVPFANSDPGLAVGEIIGNDLLAGGFQGSCPLPTKTDPGCTVGSVMTDVSFSYTRVQDTAATYSIPAGTVFYAPNSTLNVDTGSAHGLVAGDSVILKDCGGQSDSALVNGLSALPASGSQYSAVIKTVTSATRFTLAWSNALTLPGANVTCTVASALTASNLVNWVRGWDVAGNEEEVGPGDPVTVRPSLHGDVLHSRPAVINYGGSTGVVVFYGANDGVFRAVNGNQTQSIKTSNGSVRPGGELWGFIAPEFHGKFKRLFQNTPLVDIAGVMDSNKKPKDYFFDGSTTVLRDTRSGTSTAGKTYIYLTARRGGRLIYALDVSDPTTPKFLWSKDQRAIPELGQTWSQPKVALLKGRANPVLIMGAGYAPEEDADPVVAADTMGRGVLVLDAVTGEVVWAALANCSGLTATCVENSALTHSIAADVTLMDRNADGYIDRVYAADTGANIWRLDLQPKGYDLDSAPADWKIAKLASLGGAGNDARKFLFAPDVIPTSDFDAVMAVSGDREHPLYTTDSTAGLAYNVQNRIYMIKDTYPGSVMDSSFVAITDTYLQGNPGAISSTTGIATTFDAAANTVKGFYIDLPNHGEKGVNAPTTIAGKTYFGTNYPDVPKTDSCTANLGFARAYTVDFKTATVNFTRFVGGGLPPSAVSGLVEIGDKTEPFIIGGSGPTTFDPSIPEIDLNNNRRRAYWYAR